MTCDEARAALLVGEDEAAQAHFAGCSSCRAEEASWRRWRSALTEASTWDEPSLHLLDQIMDSSAPFPPPSEIRSQRSRWWEAGVAVAAVVLLVGSYGIASARTPDWTMTLEPLSPGASAEVEGWNTPAGTRMNFRIEGLEPAPPDHYYEIWLTADDGRHISAGTFRDAGPVNAWAGVRRSEFPRIWITLEPMDDDLGPSPNTFFDTVG